MKTMTLLLDKTPVALSGSAVEQYSDESTNAALPLCKFVPTVVLNTTLSRVAILSSMVKIVPLTNAWP